MVSGPRLQKHSRRAVYWSLFNDTAATTTSPVLPSTDPAGGGYMISIVTDEARQLGIGARNDGAVRHRNASLFRTPRSVFFALDRQRIV
jgi:hypothetical protein